MKLLKHLTLLVYGVGLFFLVKKYVLMPNQILYVWSENKRVSIGLTVGLIVIYFARKMNFFDLKNKISFFQVFFHELYHAILALLTSGKIYSFQASLTSGCVQVQKKNWASGFVLLAPYAFPIVPTLLAISLPFFKGQYSLLFSYVTGLSYAFYVVRIYVQTHRKQTDFQELGGVTISYFYLVTINIIHFLTLTQILSTF